MCTYAAPQTNHKWSHQNGYTKNSSSVNTNFKTFADRKKGYCLIYEHSTFPAVPALAKNSHFWDRGPYKVDSTIQDGKMMKEWQPPCGTCSSYRCLQATVRYFLSLINDYVHDCNKSCMSYNKLKLKQWKQPLFIYFMNLKTNVFNLPSTKKFNLHAERCNIQDSITF